jgi:hypothetical protein
MKYIRLKCNEYDCRCEFLIALDNWYIQDYDGEIHKYYSCPICEGMVFSEDNCVIELA